MNNPIKIIHKYKNDNRRVQYNYYIFVGSLVNQNVRKILLKIRPIYNLMNPVAEVTIRHF